MTFWDDVAAKGLASENMCHVSVNDCIHHLLPLLETHPTRILDLGCGIGRLAYPLQERVYPCEVVGEDSCELMVELARLDRDLGYSPTLPLFRHNDGITIVTTDFDAAFSIGMFQHVDDSTMQSYITQVADILPIGGMFIYQFVYEGEEAPLSYIRDYDVVRQWNILPTESLYWDQRNKWCWITGVKR